MNTNRKIEYDIAYMTMAYGIRPLSYATRSKVGCLIVSKNDQIIAQGYNGMPTGFPNTCEHTNEKGELVTNDEVLHAESNAIAKCAKFCVSTEGATAYVTLSPCFQCAKLLLQAGIKRVVFSEEYRDLSSIEFLLKGNILVQKLDPMTKRLKTYYIDDVSDVLSTY